MSFHVQLVGRVWNSQCALFQPLNQSTQPVPTSPPAQAPPLMSQPVMGGMPPLMGATQPVMGGSMPPVMNIQPMMGGGMMGQQPVMGGMMGMTSPTGTMSQQQPGMQTQVNVRLIAVLNSQRFLLCSKSLFCFQPNSLLLPNDNWKYLVERFVLSSACSSCVFVQTAPLWSIVMKQ